MSKVVHGVPRICPICGEWVYPTHNIRTNIDKGRKFYTFSEDVVECKCGWKQ